MARRGHLPSLSGLRSGLGDLAAEIISPQQLRELGWATLGGAGGFIGTGFALPVLEKIPGLSSLPKELLQGLVGVVGGRLTWNWNRDFAKGLTGGVAGHAVARGLARLVDFDFAKSLAEVEEQATLHQLPDAMDPTLPEAATETDIVTDESELAEVEVADQFQGGFGATVEEQAPLGAWLT